MKRRLFNCIQLLAKYLNCLIIKFHLTRNAHAGYDNSARVYKVISRYKDAEKFFSWLDDFVLVFEGFTAPEIILNDNISLYTINANEAVFVDCGSEDVFDTSRHALVYNAQFTFSQKVICLPLSSFLRRPTSL